MSDLDEILEQNAEYETEDTFIGLEPVQDLPAQEPSQDQAPTAHNRNSGGIWRRNTQGRRIFITTLFAIGVYLLTGICVILLPKPTKTTLKEPTSYRFIIPKTPPLEFDAFVIPLRKSDTFTYLSIGMNFDVKEGQLRKEMIMKKTELRGIIYDLLDKEINHTETIPSLTTLKRLILKALNRCLSSGEIDGIYVEQYLAV